MKLNVKARILPPEDYVWHVYTGKEPLTLTTRSKHHTIVLEDGMKFGMRPSSSGKEVRLITEKFGPTIVFTLDTDERRKLVMNSNAFEKAGSTDNQVISWKCIPGENGYQLTIKCNNKTDEFIFSREKLSMLVIDLRGIVDTSD